MGEKKEREMMNRLMYSSLNMHVKFIKKEVHKCFMVLKEKQGLNKKLKRNLKIMKCGRNKYLFMRKVLFFEVFVEQSKSNQEVILDDC